MKIPFTSDGDFLDWTFCKRGQNYSLRFVR